MNQRLITAIGRTHVSGYTLIAGTVIDADYGIPWIFEGVKESNWRLVRRKVDDTSNAATHYAPIT